MTDVCALCGRVRNRHWSGDEESVHCHEEGGEACRGVAAAFMRGIAEGMWIAKKHAKASVHTPFSGIPGTNFYIDWTDADAIVRQRISELRASLERKGGE